MRNKSTPSTSRTRLAFVVAVLSVFVTGVAPCISRSNVTFAATQLKIVFQSFRDGNREVYLMNPDGSDQINLSNNPAADQDPSISSVSKIAFDSTRDGHFQIYVMNADGSNQINLSNNLADDISPSFSPDGSKIAFVSFRDGNSEIYVMNSDGSGQIDLSNNSASDFDPSFSHDGSKIAFRSTRDGNDEIYVMNADGSSPIRLTNNSALDYEPSFSPDGSKVAFVSNRDGNNEIYVMDANGSNQIRLTNNPASDFYPGWGVLSTTPNVMAEIEDVMTTVSTSNLSPVGIKRSLNANLQAALDALQAGDTLTACSKLQDFINQVNAQRGKKIPAALADSLIATTDQIRSQLGCGALASNSTSATARVQTRHYTRMAFSHSRAI
jgi:dipeptidyl aminopeptidase/acylaminoacyl peptidase